MATLQNNENIDEMCKIIIVDDKKEVREDIIDSIKGKFPEHQFYDFDSTKEALEDCKKLNKVDIVIFNSLNSKKPNGIEFAQVIRDRHPGAILIYTTHGEKPNYKHMTKLAEFGIDSYLLRPYTDEAVSFIIRNSLNRIKSLQSYKSDEHLELESAVDNLLNNIKMYVADNKKAATE